MKEHSLRLLFVCIMMLLGTTTCQKFAWIGDYGYDGTAEEQVANLVKSWQPEFIITVGDNNYDVGAASTIDSNIGKYYSDFIGSYKGVFGSGSANGLNHFYPSPGDHDWSSDSLRPYLDYFTLPGYPTIASRSSSNSQRYYDVIRGNVHLFALDSNQQEPDGYESTSKQAHWLQSALVTSPARCRIVYFHHAPFCSATRGNTPYMQWPFASWGASAVLSGHDHVYERIQMVPESGFPYLVNGLGGRSIYSFQNDTVEGSAVRYNSDYGAALVHAMETSLNFQFYSVGGTLIDNFTVDCTKTYPSQSITPRATSAEPTNSAASSGENYILMVLLMTCDVVREKGLWYAIVEWLNSHETKIKAASVSSTLSCLDSQVGRVFYFFSDAVSLRSLQDLQSAMNNHAQGFAADSGVRDACPYCNSYILSAQLLAVSSLVNITQGSSSPFLTRSSAHPPTVWAIAVGALSLLVIALAVVIALLLRQRRHSRRHTELVDQPMRD